MSDKIRAQHLTRKAMLYVRQSSAYQVSHNLESQKLQYAMQDRLHQLGWNEIEVIDEDLGRSAAGMQTRTGFERMVAEVCLGHVGAVAAREVSRCARNSREWQQLVEGTALDRREYRGLMPETRLILTQKGSAFELSVKRRINLDGDTVEYLAADSLQSYVTGLYRAAGLSAGHSSHSGRRTFASRLVRTLSARSEKGTVRTKGYVRSSAKR